jgi:hypothetical protein
MHKNAPHLERHGASDRGLAREPPAQTKHALLELTTFLDAEVSVTQIILQALQARIVGLNVVRLCWLLVAGWVRGCARLRVVHSGFLSVGRPPGGANSAAAFLFTPLF